MYTSKLFEHFAQLCLVHGPRHLAHKHLDIIRIRLVLLVRNDFDIIIAADAARTTVVVVDVVIVVVQIDNIVAVVVIDERVVAQRTQLLIVHVHTAEKAEEKGRGTN
jgi:hypothetical protein